MAGWQQTIIVGNVGRDPEMQYTKTGQARTFFTVAVTRRWNDRQTNERREETTWFNVSVFGNQAENASQYIRKGTQVMVVGRVSARPYTNNNGENAASLDITADTFQLLGNRGDNQGAPQGGYDYGQGATQGGVDDIPF
jgi:single-strand DNA-binding protein